MARIIDIDQPICDSEPSALALGNFDGMHLGHQSLFSISQNIGEEYGYVPSVLLFKNHTRSQTSKTFRQIQSLEDKIETAANFGIQQIFLLTFDESLMQLSPEAFYETILLEKCQAKAIVCGPNYRFGFRANGDVLTLGRLTSAHRIKLRVAEEVKMNGKLINSTDIRKYIECGRVKEANALLGRPYTLRGSVIHGKKRGRALGFPTANIGLDFPYALPIDGVYISQITIDNQGYNALTNIGHNPTFENAEKKIEVHILDYSGDLYDQHISLSFLDFMREDFTFSSADSLINQMHRDKQEAVLYFKNKGEV